MTYLWCQTTHQGNQLPWELRYSIKPVWIRLWEQQTPFKSFHISKQRKNLEHHAISMAYAEQMSRKLLTQDLETHLLTYHPKREVKSTDLTMTMVTILKREHNATKRKMCGKNDITSRHYIKYLHSRIHPNFVWVYIAMELRLVALGNTAIEGIHKPSDRISSSV